MDPVVRRAALISTAVAGPLIVIGVVALVLTGGGGSSTPSATPTSPVTTAAPPHAQQEFAACTKVLEKLPVQLGKLDPRIVHTTPDTTFVVAWGDPPVILQCGVNRPSSLHPGSATQYLLGGTEKGPFYAVTSADGANVWTTVDRQPYISITIPSQYQGGNVLPPLSRAIAAALPAVCGVGQDVPIAKLCTRRTT